MDTTLYEALTTLEEIDDSYIGVSGYTSINAPDVQRGVFGRYFQNTILNNTMDGKQSI